MKKIFTLFSVLFGVLVVGVVALFLPVWDIRAVDDADLTPTTPLAPPDEENIAVGLGEIEREHEVELEALAKEVSAFDLSTEGLRDQISLEELAPFEQRARALTERFEKVVARGMFHCPTEGELASCHLNTMRELSQITNLRAYYLHRIGAYSEGIDLARVSLQAGHVLLTENPTSMIEALVGVGIMGSGLNVLEIMEADGRDVMLETESLLLPDDVFTEPLKRNYTELTKPAFLDAREGKHSTYWYQTNRTRNELAEFTRLQIDAIDDACGEESPAQEELRERVEEYRLVPEHLFRTLVSPNGGGKVFLSVVVASASDTRNRRCELNERIEALQE